MIKVKSVLDEKNLVMDMCGKTYHGYRHPLEGKVTVCSMCHLHMDSHKCKGFMVFGMNNLMPLCQAGVYWKEYDEKEVKENLNFLVEALVANQNGEKYFFYFEQPVKKFIRDIVDDKRLSCLREFLMVDDGSGWKPVNEYGILNELYDKKFCLCSTSVRRRFLNDNKNKHLEDAVESLKNSSDNHNFVTKEYDIDKNGWFRGEFNGQYCGTFHYMCFSDYALYHSMRNSHYTAFKGYLYDDGWTVTPKSGVIPRKIGFIHKREVDNG